MSSNKLVPNAWLPILACFVCIAGNFNFSLHSYRHKSYTNTIHIRAHNRTAQHSPLIQTGLSTNTPFKSKSPCALLFFGVPRLFRSTALPSIQRYMLTPNKECDVFVHSYNVTTLSVIRNNEANAELVPSDLYLLVNNDTDRILLEGMESFHAKRNLSFFHQHHHKGWGESFGSTDNMVKAWHSIQGVWDIMEHYQQTHNINYTRIGLFRLDVFYTHNIVIQDPSEKAVIPADFVWWSKKKKKSTHLVNDRGMYGNYEYARIWAAKRFAFAPEYIERQNNKSTSHKLQGIHSESFIYELLNNYQVPYQEKEMCFFRLRANGVVLHEDCIVPGLTKSFKYAGYHSLVGFNEQMLRELKCKDKGSRSPPARLCVEHQQPSNSRTYFGKAWAVLRALLTSAKR